VSTTLETRAARRRAARLKHLKDLKQTERLMILDYFYRLPLTQLRIIHRTVAGKLGEPEAKRKT
jgi:hypothetical protein